MYINNLHIYNAKEKKIINVDKVFKIKFYMFNLGPI